MDCKFLNFEFKIEKLLKLHGLKVNFFLFFFLSLDLFFADYCLEYVTRLLNLLYIKKIKSINGKISFKLENCNVIFGFKTTIFFFFGSSVMKEYFEEGFDSRSYC